MKYSSTLISTGFLLFLLACSPKKNGFERIEPPAVIPVPISKPQPKMESLAWEKVRAEGTNWSKYVFHLLETDLRSMIAKVQDMTIFCPKYQSLTDTQKINALGMLIAGIAKYESDFDPLSRNRESTMGTDPITGSTVHSEGLLQLSYQDVTGWSFCEFDWNADRHLGPRDPRKTIFDPYRNLNCGLRILAEQIDKYHRIVIDHGAYWAVLKLNGKYQQVRAIANLVQILSFCQ